jgi:hypothetical protein
MKTSWYLLLLVFLLGALLMPGQAARAQNVIHGDSMYVAWDDGSPSHLPVINALRNSVYGDTVAGGARANLNRIYVLKLNGLYWESDRIENNGYPLRLVGEKYTMGDAANYPAQLQLTDLRGDGTGADARMITGLHDVEMRNLYITGRTNAQGVQTSYQPIQIDAKNHTFIFDNNIIEQSNFAVIAFTATGNRIYYTNNKFRNLIGSPSTQQWEGRGISIWADQDTVVVENNTFFNLEFTPFQLEGGSAKYIRFNHNTIVNNGRGINTGNWFQSAYWTNNLIINAWWQGEGAADINNSGRDPRNTHAGLYTIGALPSAYGVEEGRRIVIGKTYAYIDPKFVTLGGDSIRRATYVDPVTKLDFLDKYTEHMNVGHAGTTDTVWLSSLPAGMAYPCADANWQQPKNMVTGATMIDSMWSNITLLRRGVTPATPYFYKPVANPSDEAWPLPENFSYTEASLLTAGTDGLPIGDLNWFPTQKATFYANQANYVAQIEALGGAVVTFKVDSTAEAEVGTLSGTATVAKFSGFSYFYMQNGGWIQWDFDLPTAGQYGLNIWTHLKGQDMRGEHFFINGLEVHDVMGWGELEFTSMQHAAANPGTRGPGIWLDDNSWLWYYYPKDSILAADQANLAFVAGHNTIKITPSWGYQNFAGIDLIPVGVDITPKGSQYSSPVIALRAPDATSSIVTPMGEGAKWVPSLFKSVALGANGSVAFNLTVPQSGSYRMRIFGCNPGSTAAALQVKEGSTVLASPQLPAKADSTGSDVLSAAFALTGGTHALSVAGANANVDYIQLIQEIVGAVEPGGIPSTFALEQNYPNPFNPTTTINFSLGKATDVKLIVYNVLGQQVTQLVNDKLPAGAHTVQFKATNLATGVYFYRLEAGSFVDVKKMLLLK